MGPSRTCPRCLETYETGVVVCPRDGEQLVLTDDLPSGDQTLAAGTVVGEYEITSLIGVGGFGKVYKARHPIIGKAVAIKVLNQQYSSNPKMVARFITEARAVNQIKHPNIVDIFAFGVLPDGRRYLTMELLEGTTLDILLDHYPQLPPAFAVRILRGVADALDAAHQVAIIHRDLKPGNIFIALNSDKSVGVKLLDFGIAKLMDLDEKESQTKTGVGMGTPHYMSPEQGRGLPVGARSDVYSFGVVAYRVLTGQLPFEGANGVDVLIRQSAEQAPALSSIDSTLAPFDSLILPMLSRDPAERPESAGAACLRLESIVEQLGVTSVFPGIDLLENLKMRTSRPDAPTLDAAVLKLGSTRSKWPPSSAASGNKKSKKKSDRLRWGVALAVVVSLVGIGLVGRSFLLQSSTSTMASQDSVQLANSQALPSAAVASGTIVLSPAPSESASAVLNDSNRNEIELTIDGAPAGASIYEKDKLLGQVPGPIRLTRSNTARTFTITAKGYRTVDVTVVPSANVAVSVPMTPLSKSTNPTKKTTTPKDLDSPY